MYTYYHVDTYVQSEGWARTLWLADATRSLVLALFGR